MIDLQNETVIPLTEACKHLPHRDGRPVHASTIFRWALQGLRGIKLESIKIGGSRCTSLQALARFAERLSREESSQPLPARRSEQRARRTSQILRDAGA